MSKKTQKCHFFKIPQWPTFEILGDDCTHQYLPKKPLSTVGEFFVAWTTLRHHVHRYINVTFMFTKVQNISREFANVRVKRNWCIPYLISRKLRAPSSARNFCQPFIQQVIDIIDPYLIQTIILRIYHSYGDCQSFLSFPAPLQQFLPSW